MPSQFQCPCCGANGRFHKVGFKKRFGFGFTIRAPVQCATCNAVLVQPSSVLARAATIMLFVAGAVCLAYDWVIPGIFPSAEGTRSIRTVTISFFGLIGLCSLFDMGTVAIRAGKVRILSENTTSDVQAGREL